MTRFRTDLPSSPFEIAAHYLGLGFFAFVLMIMLRDYAAVEWPVYGFSYSRPGAGLIGSLVLFLAITATFLPGQIKSPSSLSLIFIYLFVVVPAGVCTVGMYRSSIDAFTLLSAIGFPFVLICILNRSAPSVLTPPTRRPHPMLIPVFAAASAVLLAYLVFRFRHIMSFASLDSLYEQRMRGAATNLLDGYAQTYSQYFFSTGLVAFGLFKRNLLLIGFGLLGSITNFMITAEKAGLVYPLFLILLYFMTKARSRRFFRSAYFIAFLLGIVLYGAVKMYKAIYAAEFVSWYLGIRTILVPGGFTLHYLEFFTERGFTYFAHLRGLDLIVGVPHQFSSDGRWPSLGMIVGEDYFNYRNLNANANFIASDGAASLGLIGIPIVIVAFGFLLKLFDRMAIGTGQLSLLLMMPLALNLTNGSMFTMLTSFGGLLLLMMLYFAFSPRLRMLPSTTTGEIVRARPLPLSPS